MNQQPNYELLREAYAIIGGIPARKFDLDVPVKQRGESLSCGTIACAGGWLAMHPKFQALGLSVDGRDIHLHGFGIGFYGALQEVFGISQGDAMDIFGVAGYSVYDDDLPNHLSDKARWKARVKRFLRERGQLTSQLEAAKA